LLKSGPEAARLNPHDWIFLGIVLGPAIEYIHTERVFLQPFVMSLESLLDRELKEAAETGRFVERAAGENSLELGLHQFSGDPARWIQ
jgi:hypothetical protein